MYDQSEAPIEVTIEQLKAEVAKFDILDRLADNSDFQKGIIQGYLKDEAVRLTGLLADPSVIYDADNKRDVENQLTSIAYLRRYLTQARQRNATLKNELAAHLEEQQLQAEELAGEAGVQIIGG